MGFCQNAHFDINTPVDAQYNLKKLNLPDIAPNLPLDLHDFGHTPYAPLLDLVYCPVYLLFTAYCAQFQVDRRYMVA